MIYAVEDLVRILSAGGSLTLTASHYTVEDLVKLASVAAGGNSKLILKEPNMTPKDFVRIASSGNGSVMFEL